MIFNPSLRDFGETLKNQYTEIQYFEQNFEPLTETHIQQDNIAIIVWSNPPILFLIEDNIVAESYQNFFKKMWKEGINKPDKK